MEKELILLLDKVLNLKGRAQAFNSETKLLGSIPELDSLAVANLLTNLESHFGIRIEDDEVDREIFSTIGSLASFIARKKGA